MTAATTATRLSTGFVAMVALAILATFVMAGSARADLELENVQVELNQPRELNPDKTPKVNADGTFFDPLFDRQAGGHPDLTFNFTTHTDPSTGIPTEALRSLITTLPPGFVGDVTGIATCSFAQITRSGAAACPLASQVGVAEVTFWQDANLRNSFTLGVYNLPHGTNEPARFAFTFFGVLTLIGSEVNPGDYTISSGSRAVSVGALVERTRITLWGVPADPSHDSERNEAFLGAAPNSPQPFLQSANWKPVPLLTAPPRCSAEPLKFTVRGDSWDHPGKYDEHVLTADPDGTPFLMNGCEKVPFAPSAEVTPSTHAADAPSGVDVQIKVPQSEDPYSIASADVRKVKTTFPEGMSVNAASAAGLGSCSQAQIALRTNDVPSCPDSSKLGKVTIVSPALDDPLEGNIFLAKQNDNPFNSLLALYITAKGPGFWLKLAGKVETDPGTGRVTVVFDDNPQLPFETLHLEMPSGSRAPLSTPRTCGTYNLQTEFTSWKDDNPVTVNSPFVVDQNCGGGFDPGFDAGTADPTAGSYSPFVMRITRKDGEQNLSALTATLPEGLLAKLAGVPLCGDAQATAGDCPADSQVGTVTVGAGSGANPIYVPQADKAPTAVYLAGPYKGAPYSMVVKVPAQAGPFDLGTVAVRNGLYVDPTTTQVTAKSDPLPQVLQGIPIAYRDVRVEVDRPDFIVNPTNCDPMKVTSTISSVEGARASRSAPFVAADCGALGFKPKLAVRFSGAPTHRGGHPALKAVLTMPKGSANIGSAQVTLPKTEFLENAHIRTICTRVQYAADQCPKGSIYGFAKAWSPLLDGPLEGPVYLRSSNHTLPDLVASLDGRIHVDLDGRISSANKRIRNTFDFVPDAPVSKFVLKMQGGQKSLLVNTEELCKAKPRATAAFTGQNEKTSVSHPLVKVACGGAK